MHDQAGPQPEDGELIARVAAGDRRAFEALVERHWAALYRFLLAMVRDPAATEDALQEAFTAVWRGAGSFRGEAGGRTWLYAVARHAASRRYRRWERRPGALESLEALGEAAGWGDPSGEARILGALEDRERVRKALEALSPDDREVLALVDLEELTTKEAAEALGLGLPALKSRLHRARLRLLAELREEVGDEG